jgi:hypothetical protein
MKNPRMLGVLLCYNDGDLLEDSIRYLLEQNHDLVVWDHGSTDETAAVIERFKGDLVEMQYIPREFDFYELYPRMSRHLLANYIGQYDWISWPDQDEFLEGPSRSKPYGGWVRELHRSRFDWIEFNNFNYWFTSDDDPALKSTPLRVRHYSLFAGCASRIRCWRASSTNIRIFNHNAPLGTPARVRFNLRHYPMRSREQMMRRIREDRAGLRRGTQNVHYENMAQRAELLEIRPEQLHCDDGRSELNPDPIFDWWSIYGSSPKVNG